MAIPGLPGVSVTKLVDRVQQMLEATEMLARSDVLVGVPSNKANRRPMPGKKPDPITNASLAYIHEFGSPARNIPARPFLFPAIRKIKPQVRALMKKAAQDALKGDKGAVKRVLNEVGLLAQIAAQAAITDPEPPFVPLKPATIRARLRRTQAGRRQLARLQQNAKAAGLSTSQVLLDWGASPTLSGNTNIQPLIDTGQLRQSLRYVVRENLSGAAMTITRRVP